MLLLSGKRREGAFAVIWGQQGDPYFKEKEEKLQCRFLGQTPARAAWEEAERPGSFPSLLPCVCSELRSCSNSILAQWREHNAMKNCHPNSKTCTRKRTISQGARHSLNRWEPKRSVRKDQGKFRTAWESPGSTTQKLQRSSPGTWPGQPRVEKLETPFLPPQGTKGLLISFQNPHLLGTPNNSPRKLSVDRGKNKCLAMLFHLVKEPRKRLQVWGSASHLQTQAPWKKWSTHGGTPGQSHPRKGRPETQRLTQKHKGHLWQSWDQRHRTLSLPFPHLRCLHYKWSRNLTSFLSRQSKRNIQDQRHTK